MDYSEVKDLAHDYLIALDEEHGAQISVAVVESEWWDNGTIDGKNEQVRSAQLAGLAAGSDYHATLADAQAKRKHLEALIGLTKAWLYSQGSQA